MRGHRTGKSAALEEMVAMASPTSARNCPCWPIRLATERHGMRRSFGDSVCHAYSLLTRLVC